MLTLTNTTCANISAVGTMLGRLTSAVVSAGFCRLIKGYFEEVVIVDYAVNEFHLAEQTAREAGYKTQAY